MSAYDYENAYIAKFNCHDLIDAAEEVGGAVPQEHEIGHWIQETFRYADVDYQGNKLASIKGDSRLGSHNQLTRLPPTGNMTQLGRNETNQLVKDMMEMVCEEWSTHIPQNKSTSRPLVRYQGLHGSARPPHGQKKMLETLKLLLSSPDQVGASEARRTTEKCAPPESSAVQATIFPPESLQQKAEVDSAQQSPVRSVVKGEAAPPDASAVVVVEGGRARGRRLAVSGKATKIHKWTI